MALRTPLWQTHMEHEATFTEFAGYEMPVHYGSIRDEHFAVRERVGLFDVSHMSKLWVTGPDAAAAISKVCPMDAFGLEDGQGKYTVMLQDDGTILDDLFVFRMADERFWVIPNAGQGVATSQQLRAHKEGLDASVGDATSDWAILALQGPEARTVLERVTEEARPKLHRIKEMAVAGHACLVSGTGYTGEKGVEIYAPVEAVADVWAAVLAAGEPEGIAPVGLGARDTLRLEKGYCLAGNEFAGGRTPLEAGLGWVIDWDVPFAARDRLLAQKEAGDHDRLVGFVMEKGIPRTGYAMMDGNEPVGIVTSGTQSPVLRKGIGLGYVHADSAASDVNIDVRGRNMPATVQRPPFV